MARFTGLKHLTIQPTLAHRLVNVPEYWDDVKNKANAQNVTAGLAPETAAEYLGWFMDTNNMGSPARANLGQPGTKHVDIPPGTFEFARWDAGNLFGTPPKSSPERWL